ncbi:MAG: hypothetical protein RJQ08_01045 [Salinisphaeraceae bacterium]
MTESVYEIHYDRGRHITRGDQSVPEMTLRVRGPGMSQLVEIVHDGDKPLFDLILEQAGDSPELRASELAHLTLGWEDNNLYLVLMANDPRSNLNGMIALAIGQVWRGDTFDRASLPSVQDRFIIGTGVGSHDYADRGRHYILHTQLPRFRARVVMPYDDPDRLSDFDLSESQTYRRAHHRPGHHPYLAAIEWQDDPEAHLDDPAARQVLLHLALSIVDRTLGHHRIHRPNSDQPGLFFDPLADAEALADTLAERTPAHQLITSKQLPPLTPANWEVDVANHQLTHASGIVMTVKPEPDGLIRAGHCQLPPEIGEQLDAQGYEPFMRYAFSFAIHAYMLATQVAKAPAGPRPH